MPESRDTRKKTQRKERQRKNRRDHIIRTAEQYFAENSYEDSKIDQIAHEAGYTKATIYNYFESKDDLFAAVLSKSYEKMHETLNDHLTRPEANSPLETMGRGYLYFVNRYPSHAKFTDSGRCVSINRHIIMKELNGVPLTESETEFRANEEKLGNLVADALHQMVKANTVTEERERHGIVKALSGLNTSVREMVRKGKTVGQSDEEILGSLSVLFRIVEQGVKHYVLDR